MNNYTRKCARLYNRGTCTDVRGVRVPAPIFFLTQIHITMEFQVKLSQDNYVRIEDGSKVNQPVVLKTITQDVNRKRANVRAAANIAVNRITKIIQVMEKHRDVCEQQGLTKKSPIKWTKPFKLEVYCDGRSILDTAELAERTEVSMYFRASQIERLRADLQFVIELADVMGDEVID